MYERIKLIRNTLHLSQAEMGEKLGLTNATISRMEKGINGVTEQTIKTICREFNIDEDWLRNGGSNEVVYCNLDENNTFSLDEYLKSKNITDFEIQLIKSYFEIPEELRKGLVEHFKNNILPEIRKSNDEMSASTLKKDINIKSFDVECAATTLNNKDNKF